MKCLSFPSGLITSFTQEAKPNAGQPVPLACEAEDTPSAPSPASLTLRDPDGVSVLASNTSVDGNSRRTTFAPVVHEPASEYTCVLLSSNLTSVLDEESLSVEVYGK